MPSGKPLDLEAVLESALETAGIVTAQEATRAGGLGGAVAETVVAEHPTRVTIVGFEEFQPTGSAGYLIDRGACRP